MAAPLSVPDTALEGRFLEPDTALKNRFLVPETALLVPGSFLRTRDYVSTRHCILGTACSVPIRRRYIC
eukprot:3026110-Rhodomonas_salina.3